LLLIFINVIEDPAERAEALRAAWGLSRKVLVVFARLAIETNEERLTPYADGGLTRIQTFQKYYAQPELSDYIECTLGIKTVAAGPGLSMLIAPDGAKCL